MAVHYLIDGYNVIYALPEMPAGLWKEKRAALLRWLGERRPQGRNRATVVFDSRQDAGHRESMGDVTVVYPAGATADDWISDYVRRVPNPRILVVVSDDQGLRLMVRGTGARWISAREFIRTGRTARRPGVAAEKAARTEGITDEFKKRWL